MYTARDAEKFNRLMKYGRTAVPKKPREWFPVSPPEPPPKKYKDKRNQRIKLTKDGSVTPEAIKRLRKEATNCPDCGVVLVGSNESVDHIIPLSKGGKHILSNIRICCLFCNLDKGARLLDSVIRGEL